MIPIYRIKDWKLHYERSDLRKTINWTWLPIPNKHDGKGFRRIGMHRDAVPIFCGWVLILQVASKMPERGTLADENGPLDADDLATMTGFPSSIFELCFKLLVHPKIQWLECNTSQDKHKSVSGQAATSSGQHPDVSGLQESTREESTREDNTPSPLFAAAHQNPIVANPVATSKPRTKANLIRQQNPIWDCIAGLWFGGSVPEPARSRVGKICRDLKSMGATAEELCRRHDNYVLTWPKIEDTPEALVKHWCRMEHPPAPQPKLAPDGKPELDYDDPEVFDRIVVGGVWEEKPTAEQQVGAREWMAHGKKYGEALGAMMQGLLPIHPPLENAHA
jgi:hypothetical protein